MIIKGNIRTDGKALANYLKSEGRYAANLEKNEHIEIWEASGIEQGDTLQNILADFQHSAAGSCGRSSGSAPCASTRWR